MVFHVFYFKICIFNVFLYLIVLSRTSWNLVMFKNEFYWAIISIFFVPKIFERPLWFQDGSYLAELLLSKEYEVHGLIRRSSSFNTGRIQHLYGDARVSNKLLCNYILLVIVYYYYILWTKCEMK